MSLLSEKTDMSTVITGARPGGREGQREAGRQQGRRQALQRGLGRHDAAPGKVSSHGMAAYMFSVVLFSCGSNAMRCNISG